MKLDLDRYNRVVWALLGTLALLGLGASLVAGLAALWPSSRHAGTIPTPGTPHTQDTTAAPPSLRLGIPEKIQGTEFVLIPVEAMVEGRNGAGGGGFGSYSKGDAGGPLFNMVFLNSTTGASHALLAKKALITRYEMLEDRRGEAVKAAGLVFRMVEADTNGNGRLDQEDEDKVYLCDPAGKGLREIGPPDSLCERWEFDAGRRILYVLTRPKGPSDGSGPRDLLFTSLDGNQPLQPLLSKARMDELRSVLQQ
ncbi:MAG: hypothetical protein Q8K67_05120 [Geothrix sp.]|nr:hypothetical protein [Geothrix sp.]